MCVEKKLFWVSFVIMLAIGIVYIGYIYYCTKKTSKHKISIKRDSIVSGLFLGTLSYIPFAVALLTSILIVRNTKDYSMFSSLSIAAVILYLIILKIVYVHKLKDVTANDERESIIAFYNDFKKGAKSLFLMNSIIIGAILYSGSKFFGAKPIGFLYVDGSQLGWEIFSGLIPVIGFSAVDYFEFPKNVFDFFKDMFISLKTYFGIYVYMIFFSVGYIFFLNSKNYYHIFLGGTIGISIPVFGIILAILVINSIQKHKKSN